jgi:formylglycine-generating enzyme required for sulfatase activity
MRTLAKAWLLAAGVALCVPALAQGTDRGAKRVEEKMNPDRRVALVIGNAKYQRGSPLRNAANDAVSIAAVLKELKFEVVTGKAVTEATKVDMEKALTEFRQKLRGAGVALFYYAGHGIQIDGTNYLIPVEVDMTNRDQVLYNTINLDTVLTSIGSGTAQVQLVILDACRDNPFGASRSGGSGGLAQVKAREDAKGILIAFSTSPGRVAADGEPGKNGLYTSQLLVAMKKPGLPIEAVFKQTRLQVAELSKGRQVPWESTSLTGELVLIPGQAGTTTTVAVASTTGSADSPARSAKLAALKQPEKRSVGESFRNCDRCPEMVLVPAADSFRMGSPADEPSRHPSEGPMREVKIPRPFAVGKYEVTYGEWEACLLDGGCKRWPRGEQRGRRPVVDVNWEDARSYIDWLNTSLARAYKDATGMEKEYRYRLLSEAEWEYVARAGSTTARPWGAELGKDQAQCRDCLKGGAPKGTSDVGKFAANKFKLHDVLGNAWEWVADCYNPGYENAPADGSAWTAGDCARRILRGGSWTTAERGVRAAARAYYPAQRRDMNIGFRVAVDLD